jgi:NAD(P)-dependent dehydrogenase (short-subunit alcohol dehydrogenase family)
MFMGRLDEKVVLVTGAAGAIGSAVADAVREHGGTAITSDLRRDGVDHALDVTSEADWARVIDAIERGAGRLDGLVNAAGIVAVGTVEDTDFVTWRRVLAVNLDGTFLGCKHAMPLLRRGGGAIVNISSVMGRISGRGFAAYGTAKAALSHYSRLAAADLAPRIRVNAIAVGSVATSALDLVLSDDQMRAAMQDATPLHRIGDPDDIAATVVYLASPAGSFVTGKVLEVDGGLQQANADLGLPDLG